MKKLTGIIISLALCFSFLGVQTSAEKFRSDRSRAFCSGLTEDIAATYIKEYHDSAEEIIKKAINEMNLYAAEEIKGEIKITRPFSVPTLYYKNERLCRQSENTKYTAVICKDNVIGIMNMHGSSYNSIEICYFYPVSENAAADIGGGVSFYYQSVGSSLSGDGGLAYNCYMAAVPGKKASLAYFDSSIFYEETERTEDLNTFTGHEIYPGSKQLKKYNFIDKDTEIIHSFEYYPEGERNITDGGVYSISCRGAYLTYEDGRFFLKETNDTETGKFIISKDENGLYSIAPKTAPDKKIKAGGADGFELKLSYFNRYCYTVCKPDNGLVMTATDNGIVFAQYHTSKHNLSNQVWTVTKE